MWRSAIAMTAAASGGLIRNTQRQDPARISHPPRNGAMAAALPLSPAQAPIARARSDSTKVAWMIARLAGVSSAPPTPCRARPAISHGAVGARAHSSEARANQAIPHHEDPSAPEPVAAGPAEQDQRGEGERVAGDRPLQGGEADVQVAADVRQRDVDDGGVDPGDPGAEHAREHDPATLGRGQRDRGLRVPGRRHALTQPPARSDVTRAGCPPGWPWAWLAFIGSSREHVTGLPPVRGSMGPSRARSGALGGVE